MVIVRLKSGETIKVKNAKGYVWSGNVISIKDKDIGKQMFVNQDEVSYIYSDEWFEIESNLIRGDYDKF